ncbi:Two component system response regulator modulated with antisigma-factor antagonist domain [uncultured Desulfatiglans sp.]|nr:Two component system response regulator modulated with antisigma-factor antagonist domain [uncultured Desulfatiglans sp.]
MGPKPKVLVIDDENANLTMFRLFLSAYGYEVLLAENGAGGLALFEKEKPRIVFTDIKMPGIDGFEVLQRIKAADPGTQVIVITGHGDMDLALQALDLDATDFINKPIGRSALDSALDRAEKRLKRVEKPLGPVFSFRKEGEVLIFEVAGRLDGKTGAELLQDWRRAGREAGGVLIHFAATAGMNSAGIAALIQLLSDAAKSGRKAVLTGLTENLREIMTMVGVTRLAPVFEREEEGLLLLKKSVAR